MKISIFAVNSGFIKPIEDELIKYHEVKSYNFISDIKDVNDNIINLLNIKTLLDWCDVAFFDFAHYPLNQVCKLQEFNCKIIVRIHGIEVYEWLDEVDWDKVSAIICSAPQYERIKTRKEIPSKVHILPIGTKLDVFTPPHTKQFGKNLCMVNYIQSRKRIYTTIETLINLLGRDWKLHVRGKVANVYRVQVNNEYAKFINELLSQYPSTSKNIFFYTKFLPELEYAEWLRTKDIIINNSTQEGYGKSIIDAMACGVYPVIKNWLGADLIFPDEYLFNTQQELVDKIDWWENRTQNEKLKLSKDCVTFTKQHNEKTIAKKIREIVERL